MAVDRLVVFVLLISAGLLFLLAPISSSTSEGGELINQPEVFIDSPGCRMKSPYSSLSGPGMCLNNSDANTTTCAGNSSFRIVVIGDVHGHYSTMLIDLFLANITVSDTNCEWKSQSVKTLLVQMGDIVDRGNGSTLAWRCLRHLQASAAQHNGQVVRLLGNHEAWWLEGNYRMVHRSADTKESIREIVLSTVEDIRAGQLVGAFSLRVGGDGGEHVLFTHAGISARFFKHISEKVGGGHTGFSSDAEMVADHVNSELLSTLSGCTRFPCPLRNPIFEAGPERGGRGIGGPLWSDYSVLESAAADENYSSSFVQVVGHTAYDEMYDGEDNYVRFTDGLRAVCVDAAMYMGYKAFLEIGIDGHFRSFEVHDECNDTIQANVFTSLHHIR
eukprot:gene36455-47466_t